MVDLTRIAKLFDAEWYRATYDIGDHDPWIHFQQVGTVAGLDPNPMFHTAWYLRRYSDVAKSGVAALEDYVSRGAMLGRDPSPLFSTKWYLDANPDVLAAGINPLEHYLSGGSSELRDPSPVFYTAWYFAMYPRAAAPGIDARIHYFDQGAFMGYSPCPHFDARWYSDTYPEVAANGINPLLHYLTEGSARGFDPGPRFSTRDYLKAHPEVAASGDNPLVHYLMNDPSQSRSSGIPEMARATPLSRAAIADAQALIDAMSQIEPELAAIPPTLDILPVVSYSPDRRASAWRGLYLSIYRLPQRLVLVGSIDDTPGLARLLAGTPGLLIIETDRPVASTAESLPRGTEWRSLSEFGENLDCEDRLELTTALVNGLQPDALLVWGSRTGWDMLAEHGGALRANTALFATAAPSSDSSATELLRNYFRSCIGWISALYGFDMRELHRIADLFGLPAGEFRKLQNFETCWDADGFLGPRKPLR